VELVIQPNRSARLGAGFVFPSDRRASGVARPPARLPVGKPGCRSAALCFFGALRRRRAVATWPLITG